MIGFICAMDLEAAPLLAKMKNKRYATISGIKFTKGKLLEKDAVIAVSGVGKVFAAMCTQAMIMKYNPELIINIGVAGALKPEANQGEIAICANVLQHDVDTTALGDLRGQISGLKKINFKCVQSSIQPLRDICKAMGIKEHRGPVASGDQFIGDKKKKDDIYNWFGAVVCDMEAGAIGQVCYVNNVPLMSVKAISDKADGKAPESFAEYADKGAALVTDVICKYIQENL